MMKLRLFSKKKIAHIRNMICTQTRFVSSGGRKQPTHRQTITMFLIPHRECPSTLHMCVHMCSYMCTVQGWTETTHVEDSCYNASIITTCLLYVLLYWHVLTRASKFPRVQNPACLRRKFKFKSVSALKQSTSEGLHSTLPLTYNSVYGKAMTLEQSKTELVV